MSGSDWYVSDSSGRALVALAAGLSADRDLLDTSEMNHLAYRHGLAVPAARSLDPSTPRGQYMAAVVARMAARRTRIDTHLRSILEMMADHGVTASVVKGPAIARLYRDPSVRTYTDVDLIIPRSDLQSALDVMARYEAVGAIPAKVPAADKRDIVLRDPSGIQFTVDLHWDLFSFHQLGGSAKSAMDEAWEGAHFDADSPLGPMWVLPDPAVISFLALHALLDHRFRLILFRDFKEVAQAGTDWAGLAEFAQRHGVAEFNYLAWLIAAKVVGTPVPETFLQSVRQRSRVEKLAEHYLSRVDLIRFDGHKVHPLNLALMLVHDRAEQRRNLLRRAPLAFPRWRKRVQVGAPLSSSTTLDILVTSNARRGAEVFGRSLADRLLLRGWDVSLVSLHGGEQPSVDTTPIVEGALRLRGLRASVLLGVRHRLKTHRPGVVLANGGATLRYSIASCLLMRSRPRLVYGSIGEPGFWLRGGLHRWIQRALIRACDHVTAVSAATARELMSELGVPAEKITVVHPGVDDHWFDIPDRLERNGPMRVLFAGKLSFEKAPLIAMEVAHSLEGRIVMRMVGDGPQRSLLEGAAGGSVEVVGSVPDLTEHMEWADVLILTSLTEGLPGVAVEAAASGLPVVASDVGGVNEIVTDGVTGFLVAPSDVSGFVDALNRLHEDAGLRAKMGEAARIRANDGFRLSMSVDAYESVLRMMTDR